MTREILATIPRLGCVIEISRLRTSGHTDFRIDVWTPKGVVQSVSFTDSELPALRDAIDLLTRDGRLPAEEQQ